MEKEVKSCQVFKSTNIPVMLCQSEFIKKKKRTMFSTVHINDLSVANSLHFNINNP